MSEKLVRIASFNTSVEANFAQNVLAEEGIESCLENDATVGMLGYLNIAVGGVKLHVNESDAERARALLVRHLPEQLGDNPQINAAYPDGRCKKCDAKLEPGFEVCWSCGEPVEEQTADAVDGELAADQSRSATSPVQKHRKRRPEKSETSRETIIDEADDLAKKAWFASVLGIFLCPPILHVYSAFLIALILANRFPLSRIGSRRLLYAAVLDILVFIFLGWIVWWNVSS